MLQLYIFRPPLNDTFKFKSIAVLTWLKGITETNTHNVFLENKLTAVNFARNTIKTPSKITSNI